MSDSTSQRPSFYITTPIYYVNAAPHLGTAYSTLVADVQARFRRASGYDVKFLTGLDEHGEKVAASAAEHSMAPQAWCDVLAPSFQDLWETLEITHDDFIRTTEARQTQAVQHLWSVLKDRGYIYKGSYDGWYCVADETYFTDTQVAKATDKQKDKDQYLCPDCGRALKRVQEESWFFKLSAFEEPLLDLYQKHPHCVEPSSRRHEVVSFIKSGLKDLSISRTSFDWGIPLPFDENHITYVWFDALINYLTAVGYGSSDDALQAEFHRRWPAQVHVIGKDILRFHCVIWPAMLMAAGLSVPEQVFVHGFLLVKNEETGVGEKMSKSRGNAIAPADVIELLGVEGYRYYFMVDVVPGTDGAISFSRMRQVYNADLANNWGNLVSRALTMSIKYFDGTTPELPSDWATRPNPLATCAEGLVPRYARKMSTFAYGEAASEVMTLISAANRYIEEAKPWSLAQNEENAEELSCVVGYVLEVVRIAAHLLAPFMPETSAEVLRRMGASDEIAAEDLADICRWGRLLQKASLTKGAPLFPRLDAAQ